MTEAVHIYGSNQYSIDIKLTPSIILIKNGNDRFKGVRQLIIDQYEMKPLNVTWNKNWISDYESPWGIFEKFKYANSISVKPLFEVFGTKRAKEVVSNQYGQYLRNLITLEGVDDEIVQSLLGFSLIKMNQNHFNLLVGKNAADPRFSLNYFHNHLNYCVECLKQGYHSILHQFSLLSQCPFHEIPLINKCPQCRLMIPYELSDNLKNPFQCQCSYSFMTQCKSDLPFNTWKQSKQMTLKSKPLVKWISLLANTASELHNLFYIKDIYLGSTYPIMDLLLDATEPIHYTKLSDQTSYFIESNYKERDFRRNKNIDAHLDSTEWVEKIYNEIYHSTKQVFKSIARHYKKTIFKEHHKCIKKFIRKYPDGDICSFAYAYVNWRKSIEGTRNYWEVENKQVPQKRYLKQINFHSKQDHLYLEEVLNALLNHIRNNRLTIDLAAIKWVVNRVMAFKIVFHLKKWLIISEEYSNQKEILYRIPFGYDHLPFFALQFPTRENMKIKFHWWNDVSI